AFKVGPGASFNGGSVTHTFYNSFTNNGTVTSSGFLQFLPSTPANLSFGGTAFSSTGTVRLGGTGLITLAGNAATFDTVSIANTHAAGITANTNWTITGALGIDSGSTVFAGVGLAHTIAGNLTIDGYLDGQTSTFVFNGATEISGEGHKHFHHVLVSGTVLASASLDITGDFTNNGAFDATGFDVLFEGTSSSVISGTTSPMPFDSLVIGKTSATVSLDVNLASVSALSIASGTLDCSTYSISQLAGSLTMDAGAILKLGGTNPLPVFDSYSFDPASTVEFAGTGTQTIAAQNYGGLKTSSTGARVLASVRTIGIAGNFAPGANAFTNAGSTIDFNGASAQVIPAFNFHHLTTSSSGARTLATNGTVGVAGMFSPGGNAFTVTNSSVSFNGAGAQTIPAFNYHHLATAGSGTKTLGDAVGVGGSLLLGGGIFADAGFTATVKGDLASTISHTGSGKILLSGGTTNHVLSGGGTWGNLELNDAQGALLFATNLTVNGTFQLTAGKVATDTNWVIILPTGSVARTAGHIAGMLQKTVPTGSPAVVFEIGGATSFAPVSLNFSNITAAATILARTIGTDHPDIARSALSPAKSVNRYWSLTNSSGAFGSCQATLEFVPADFDALANPTNFLVGKLTGTNWTSPAVLSRSATNLQTTSLTSLGDFQVAEAANTPPVAATDVVTRGGGTNGVKVLLSVLLANDTDVNGDVLSIVAVTNTSARGAYVMISGRYVFYTPASAIDVDDSFTYTLSDGQGGTATGTVSVNIGTTNETGRLSSIAAGSGSFYGAGNSAYTVQYINDLSGTNWLILTNLTTSAGGLRAFADPGPLPSQRFYRVVYP
ncbi:MAG: cadherin-like domain-containing protein, partial [Verrucomicrobiota bacterium]